MRNKFIDKISFYIQRSTHNVQLRNLMCGFIRLFLPNQTRSGTPNILIINNSEKEIINDLKNSGISELGYALKPELIDKIKGKLLTFSCYDTAKSNAKVELLALSDDVQLAHYMRKDLSQIPEIVAIANDSKILNVVSEYFGAKPTISNINCWWSFGNREAAKEAQFYHRDLDDYKFLKLFFYLTDVTDESGPHIYVKHSHTSNNLNELRRFSDREVIEGFGEESILTLIKPKGACFIEDTYGVHKGQLPVSGNRLLLQIQYSYLPLYVEKYEPIQSDLVKDFKLDTYTNRLLFRR